MACVYWVDILYILIAQAPDRDVPTGQKPDGPDQGIAILKTGISCTVPERCGSASKGNPQQ